MSSSKPKSGKKTAQGSKSSHSSDPALKQLQQQATKTTESSKEAKPKPEEPSAKTAEPSGTKAVKQEIDDLDSPQDSAEESGGEGEILLAKKIEKGEYSNFSDSLAQDQSSNICVGVKAPIKESSEEAETPGYSDSTKNAEGNDHTELSEGEVEGKGSSKGKQKQLQQTKDDYCKSTPH